jgi:hypothetical protein
VRLFLRDILAEKRRRGDADAELFRRVVSFEFAAGLNATAEGAARAMRRWVDSRPAWVSDAQHTGRVVVLAAIERALARRIVLRDDPVGRLQFCTAGRLVESERNGSSDHLAALGSEGNDYVEVSRQSPTLTIGFDIEVSSSSGVSPRKRAN